MDRAVKPEPNHIARRKNGEADRWRLRVGASLSGRVPENALELASVDHVKLVFDD